MNQAGSFEDPGQGLLDFARIFRHSDEGRGCASTSSSVTTPAPRPASPPTPWTPPASATSSSGPSGLAPPASRRGSGVRVVDGVPTGTVITVGEDGENQIVGAQASSPPPPT